VDDLAKYSAEDQTVKVKFCSAQSGSKNPVEQILEYELPILLTRRNLQPTPYTLHHLIHNHHDQGAPCAMFIIATREPWMSLVWSINGF